MSRQSPSSSPITHTAGFWELRAEQVMDRVFGGRPEAGAVQHRSRMPAADVGAPPTEPAPSDPIDVTVREVLSEPAAQKPQTPSPDRSWQRLAWGSLVCLPLLLLIGVLLRNLNHSETALNQERSLLLLERLRSINGPGQGAGAGNPEATAAGGQPESGSEGLPPPPPSDDWMTELGQLPRSSAPQTDVLRVPPSSQITAAAPPATGGFGGAGSRAGGPLPVLVGVIQAQGRGGSAIFQVEGASTTASPGELIGSSGWRLRSAAGDSALIERGGEQRRVSINSGL